MMSYFPLDAVLNDAVRIPVITRAILPFCGFLDPKQQDQDLPKGSSIEVPIWLVKSLSHINIFQVEPNEIINDKTSAELAIMPCLHSPKISPARDFKYVADFMITELSKKHEALKISYAKSLKTAITTRNKNGGGGLTEKEIKVQKYKQECSERYDRIMAVRFK
ncbi:hypothetical protein SS50377_23117 [Spironucleus salmonicida]|uniref:DNA replication complex GINS protein PSF3 N-terminal domain-containing protein n=1 Tax=Spironucleus salmonicida TaxID=348837 RepID=V6LBW9_9EUKA|nr:hypothetical protein SS50377_23117 [Spironucleus salmonicida]|eukprot:EST41708.1 hypothetical protein SS50377_18795 [Spironucleus salmonicida]